MCHAALTGARYAGSVCVPPGPVDADVASAVALAQVQGAALPVQALAAHFGSATVEGVAALLQSVEAGLGPTGAAHAASTNAVHGLVAYTVARRCPHVPLVRGQVFVVDYGGEEGVFRVEATVPPGPVIVGPDTALRLREVPK